MHKFTIDELLLEYKHLVNINSAKKDTNVELEIRFNNVDYDFFSSVHNALLELSKSVQSTQSTQSTQNSNDIKVTPGYIVQSFNAIHNLTKNPGSHSVVKESRSKIWEKIYDPDTPGKDKKSISDNYREKISPYPRVLMNNISNISYFCNIAVEKSTEKFTYDSYLIRFKARNSFDIDVQGLKWRIDLTVVNQMHNPDGSVLSKIKNEMFETDPTMTSENFLGVLKLADDTNKSLRPLYKYEIEVELIDPDKTQKLSVTQEHINTVAEKILQLADPHSAVDNKMRTEILRIADTLDQEWGDYARHKINLKRVVNQAMSLSKVVYRDIYPPIGYYVTDKADGYRGVCLVHDGVGYMITTDFYEYNPIKKLTEKIYQDLTIVDGEYVNDTFYAFDVISVAGNNIASMPFKERIKFLTDSVNILREVGIKAFPKDFYEIPADMTIFEKTVKTMFLTPTSDNRNKYEIDGLILISANERYSDTMNYKVKDSSHNTIDFLAKRVPATLLGKLPYEDKSDKKLYLLFVGVARDMHVSNGLDKFTGYNDIFVKTYESKPYFPIQFSPSSAPYAYMFWTSEDIGDKIVELKCASDVSTDETCNQSITKFVNWELIRIREDRKQDMETGTYFGNDYRTAEIAWMNYMDPFKFEHLWNGVSVDNYFKTLKDPMYIPQITYLTYIKTNIINSISQSNCVVDIGFGSGKDIRRYLNANIHKVYGIDSDKSALSEAISVRKYEISKRFLNEMKRERTDRHESKLTNKRLTSFYIVLANLNEEYSINLEKMLNVNFVVNSADAIICNLAFHYFLATPAALSNIITLYQCLIRSGGVLSILSMDGKEIHKLFMDNNIKYGETWDSYMIHDENSSLPKVRKFSLKRLYKTNILEKTGQQIGVLLPFSNGEYYTEYLVNYEYISEQFKDNGFNDIQITNVMANYKGFEVFNSKLFNALKDDDKKYLSLFSYFTAHKLN